MKKESISVALNMLSDDIIEETEKLRSGSAKAKTKQKYVKWGALAACLCLIVAGAFVWFSGSDRRGGIPNEEGPINEDTSVQGGTHTKEDFIGEDKVSASLSPAFMYQGNLYEGKELITNTGILEIVGEKLGTAKMAHSSLITEWGNEDFIGTINGDIYEVKGYDPSFMLCEKAVWEDGFFVEIFIRKTGWEFKNGSELFEDKLHLSEKYSGLRYETLDSWGLGWNNVYDFKNKVLIEKFIAEIDSAEFIPCDNVPFDKEHYTIFDLRLYHLYFDMKNGIKAEFYFLQNGYVIYEGVSDICVKISEDTYKEMLEAFEKRD